jgi:hypothetical protein
MMKVAGPTDTADTNLPHPSTRLWGNDGTRPDAAASASLQWESACTSTEVSHV